MRDHSSPGALAQPLPATGPTAAGAMSHRTTAQEEQPPARRRSREELPAAHQRARARVRAEVQRQMDAERRDLVRKVQQRFHQKSLGRTAARPLRLPYRFAAPLVALLVFIFGGAWFEMLRGGDFLATGNAALRAVTPWVVLAAVPAWYWVLCRAEVWAPRVYEDMPTWFVRRMVVFPFAALLGAAAIGAAPWGWAAYLGGLSGTASRMEVRVVSVDPPRRSSRCQQHASVELRGAMARVCVDAATIGAVPRAGDTLVVSGRMSRWGVHVESVHSK